MRKKADIVTDIAERSGMPKATVEAVLNAQRDSVNTHLKDNGEYQIPDIGILKLGERPARKGRNPQTGQAIDIAAATTVKFKVAKPLKDSVQ